MAICCYTGRRTQFGNTRSHARNKQRRTWKANIQKIRLYDPISGVVVRHTISARALRTLTKHGLLWPKGNLHG
jgi:large subunit ribosomal protein L28